MGSMRTFEIAMGCVLLPFALLLSVRVFTARCMPNVHQMHILIYGAAFVVVGGGVVVSPHEVSIEFYLAMAFLIMIVLGVLRMQRDEIPI
jgi:hypothetical protein